MRKVGLVGIVLLSAMTVVMSVAPAPAEQYQSRLGRLLLNKSSLYLPTRLVLGQDNKFVVKAQPGSHVRVFLSPQSQGMVTENGLGLKVGSDNEVLEGVVPENGVLQIVVPIPAETEWEGKILYVDAIASQSATFENPIMIELIDATGRRSESNALVLAKPADNSGPPILPAMPGLPAQAINQITTMGQIYSNPDDPRRKFLDDGELNRDAEVDQNPFAVRPGIQPGTLGR